MSTVSVSHLARGTYLMTIEYANGKTFVDQFMKL